MLFLLFLLGLLFVINDIIPKNVFYSHTVPNDCECLYKSMFSGESSCQNNGICTTGITTTTCNCFCHLGMECKRKGMSGRKYKLFYKLALFIVCALFHDKLKNDCSRKYPCTLNLCKFIRHT